MNLTSIKILTNEIHPLKLFNLVSEKNSISFLLDLYNKYLESNFKDEVLYYGLSKYDLDLFKEQRKVKIKTYALIALEFNEITVFELSKRFESIEDILISADLFFNNNLLTVNNRLKLLNKLLEQFPNSDIFDLYLEFSILDIIKKEQPIHKNILFYSSRKLMHEVGRNDIEWALKKLISKNKVQLTVNGYSILRNDLSIAEGTVSNYSFINNLIGNHFIELNYLIEKLMESELDLPKDKNYFKRLIRTSGFIIEDNFVLNSKEANLMSAINNWLGELPGIIDLSNSEKKFKNNKKILKLLNENMILIFYQTDKLINVRKFIEPQLLMKLWSEIYSIIPNGEIFTTNILSTLPEFKNIFKVELSINENIFIEYFLESLVSWDSRLNKIKRIPHVFSKGRKISKLDLVYEVVNESNRVSIQILKYRLSRDYGVDNFDYNLITKSINKFDFYKDPKNYIYSSYETYVNFMKRGK